MTSPLDQPLARAIGGRSAGVFQRAFGHETVGDLLHHYPRRYAHRAELTALSSFQLGEEITIVAEVLRASSRPMRGRRGDILEVQVSDGTDSISLIFFNQPWREKELRPGARGVFAGKVTVYGSSLQLAHPDYELFEGDALQTGSAETAEDWASRPIPIYPATARVPTWKTATAIGTVLDTIRELDDPVPQQIRRRRGMFEPLRTLELVHRPETDTDWRAAQRDLRFTEAFVLQAELVRRRIRARATPATPRHPGARVAELDARLPFELTGDQRTVGTEIDADLARSHPMSRLVQGEVGSGKTLVALRAMLAVIDSGGQAALLAPTEVLAAQHLRSIVQALGPDLAARIRPTLLTGSLGTAERRKAMLAIASGGAGIAIGTHALLGDHVTFAELGLVVVDEQHRFGVDQREALRRKGGAPHVLVLTATPIPRTVAMTVFGDLDVSTIAELPAGRAGIETHLVAVAERPGWESRMWERAAEEIERGRQVFVVCPAIDQREAEEESLAETGESSTEDAAAGARPASVTEVFARLREDPRFAGRRIEALHGRMPGEKKDAAMRAFAEGAVHVLVATTVIEVGVDVPNASMMIVLDADRFGISQLHQIRGRVGRGRVPGLCLLATRAAADAPARERLDAVAGTLDGFELARVDLELRREGDVLGRSQSGGRSSLKLLRVARDGELIAEARSLAEGVLESDPELAEHPALREELDRRLDEAEREFLAKT